MFSNFRSPNKVYVREICSNDRQIYQGGDERLGSPAGLWRPVEPERPLPLTVEGSGLRDNTKPASTTPPGTQQNVLTFRGALAAAPISMETSRVEEHGGSSGLDSAILTFDPADPSICYTPHAPKKEHQGNQPATLLTKEEGKEPKHGR